MIRSEARIAEVGCIPVRRLLPRRTQRTVGAWCFIDHLGPVDNSPEKLIQVGPHPHCGLQTVTWLVEGEIVHRDSLGAGGTVENSLTAQAGSSLQMVPARLSA